MDRFNREQKKSSFIMKDYKPENKRDVFIIRAALYYDMLFVLIVGACAGQFFSPPLFVKIAITLLDVWALIIARRKNRDVGFVKDSYLKATLYLTPIEMIPLFFF